MVAANQNQKATYTENGRVVILPNKNYIVNLKRKTKSYVFELISARPLKGSSQSTEKNK